MVKRTRDNRYVVTAIIKRYRLYFGSILSLIEETSSINCIAVINFSDMFLLRHHRSARREGDRDRRIRRASFDFLAGRDDAEAEA